MTLRRLVLWRHGETEFNAIGRMQGQLDTNLTAAGVDQAVRAASALATLRPRLLVTSDLDRAVDTAAVLTERTGLVANPDKRLREIHLGQWQGLTFGEVEAEWPGALLTWRMNAEWAPPGGETRVEAAARAAEVVTELDAGPAEEVVLCTHDGIIGGLTAALLDLPVSTWAAFDGIDNCRWAVLERRRTGPTDADVRWRLAAYNVGPA